MMAGGDRAPNMDTDHGSSAASGCPHHATSSEEIIIAIDKEVPGNQSFPDDDDNNHKKSNRCVRLVNIVSLIILILAAIAACVWSYFLNTRDPTRPPPPPPPAAAAAATRPEVTGLAATAAGTAKPAKPAEESTEPVFREDPSGRNTTLPWKVPQNGTGLNLLILNALNDSWTPIFTEYIEAWDAGYDNVDPVTLKVQRVEYDADCRPFPDSVKVCNGDYGKTNWRGMNIVLLRHGYIVYSVIKLNDYWLYSGREVDMRYTMCHELGHGIGLAHSDE